MSESLLCAYVSHLADQGLKHSTLKVYLSAVRYLQIASGLGDPFGGVAWPRLDYVMRGIKKADAEKGSNSKQRLPITPSILCRLKELRASSSESYDIKMMWAACCLAFFAFLRVGEMTVSNDQSYDDSVHLSVRDIAVDHPAAPSIIQIRIKQSKTDPFRQGVNLFLGRTGTSLCPASAIISYLSARGMSPGPLFRFQDSRPLTRQRFVDAVRDGLHKIGIDKDKYCGHSFRIGAATTAAAKGMEDSVIKTLGRWESLAYLRYVKIPRAELAGYSALIASP